jgi:hypothetical protein
VEEGHAGRDRRGVREERSDARRRESAAALEPELEQEEGDRMCGEHCGNEEHPPTACDSRLRPDIARCVQEAGADTQTRAGNDEPAAGTSEECGDRARGGQPQRNGGPRAVTTCVCDTAAHEGESEHDQSANRDGDSDPLASGERDPAPPPHEQNEHGDPARRRGLDE